MKNLSDLKGLDHELGMDDLSEGYNFRGSLPKTSTLNLDRRPSEV